MSHTPGPWKRYIGSGAIEIRGGTVGSLTQPRVSRVLRADPNCDANANLIAAAPELLNALRAMLVATESKETEAFKGHYDTYLHTVAIPRAIAAIAEATGETE
jgi:hypothetical protein